MSEALTQFTWATDPEIVFNDTTDIDNFYRVGMFLSDTFVRNIEDEKPNSDGIVDYDSVLGKGVFQVPVEIFAEDQATINDMVAKLKTAFNPKLLQMNAGDGEIIEGGYVPWKWTEMRGEDELDLMVYLKPAEIPKVIRSERNGTGRNVQLTLKAKQPYVLGQTSKELTSTGTTDISGSNDGDLPAIPVITIAGNSNSTPRVTNNQTGEYIELSADLSGSDTYVIDCENATVTKNGSNAYGDLATASSFFSLLPGDFTLSLTNVGSAVVTVEYRDTYTL